MTGAERLELHLGRIAAVDPTAHVFISLTADRARAAAAASDRRAAEGRGLGPLDGLLVAVKDNIAVAGVATTAGFGAFTVDVADEDAPVVRRLESAGAILVGTLNMHEGALGATTDNPWFGRCANPHDPARTPGGSSGGSGAAVAGHLVDASLGTDTLGSIRIPAAYCGVYGLKPTPGLVPRTGLVPLSWTLDTVGPLARDPATLAAMLRVLVGFDRDDPESRPPPDRWERGDATARDLKGVRFGIPRQIETVGIEASVAAAFEAVVARAIAAGAEVRPLDIDGWSPGVLRRAGLLVAEAEAAALLGPRILAAEGGISDGFRAALAFAGKQSAVRLAEAQALMRGVGHATRGALATVDALLMPTAPQRAFLHGGAVPVDQADLTALANIAGLPALSFPAGAAPDGLPAGIQLVGRPLDDLRLLGWSALLVAS